MVAEAENLENWLASIGLQEYATLFRDNAIDLDILCDVDNADLAELGVPLGDRKRLLASIKQFDQPDRVFEPAPAATTRTVSGADKFVERRQVTVLFCDLVGSTALSSRLDPEDLNAAIRNYQTACDDVVKKFGGYTGNFLGDGILAYFGWPMAHEDDAQRAVHAGISMTEITGTMTAADGTVLAARVGIATGLVMVGEMIGEGTAQQETVVGATPNVAAKLQSFAQPGNIVITDSTRELLGSMFELSDLGEYEIPGVENKIQVWNVDRIRTGATRFEVQSGTGQVPLVGRAAEIQQLMRLWESARAGAGEFVKITGEAGVGKSKLVQAFYDWLAKAPHRLVRLQGSSFHSNTSFYPVIDGISSVLDITGNETDKQILSKLSTALKSAGSSVEPATSLLARLLGLAVELPKEFQSFSPQLKRERTIAAVLDILTSGAQTVPLLVIVEDIHWIDPSTADVLDELAKRIAVNSILVILTARPDYELANWADRADIQHLDIGTLTDEQVRVLILEHTGGRPLPEDATAEILSHTDGVPLFVEELTKTVLASGQLIPTENGYVLKDSLPKLAIPSTLQASLLSRLDQQPSAKPVAQAAATIGRSFSSELLEFVAGIPTDVLEQHLGGLCSLGILNRQEDNDTTRYHFTHALVQETAYQSQLRARRRDVHAQIAGALEGAYADLPENRPEILAHHLEEAGEIERATNEYLKAGRLAISACAVKEAMAHLSNGLRALRTLNASNERDLMEMRIQASIGTSLMLDRGWAAPEVQRAYTRASDLSEIAEDTHEKLWILWGAWVSRHVRGHIIQAQAMSEHIRTVASERSSDNSMLIADMISLQAAFYSGNFDSSIKFCEAMRKHFNPDEHRALVNLYSTDLEVVALLHQSIAMCAMGCTVEALELRKLAEQTGRSLNHPYTLSWLLAWGATVTIFAGDLQLARKLVTEALTIATAQGYDYVISLARFYLGYLETRGGGGGHNLDEMYKGLKDFRSTGAEIAVPHFSTLIASVLTEMGKPEEAMKFLQEAEGQIRLYGEAWQECEVYRNRAEAMQKMTTHRPEAIEAEYKKAISLGEKQHAAGWRWRAIMGLVEYWLSIGQEETAATFLEEATSRHENCVQCADFLTAKEVLLGLRNANEVSAG